MLTVDTETKTLDWWTLRKPVFMVQWADAHGEYVCDENTGWQPFLDAIAREDMLVFANAPFDIAQLWQHGIVDLLRSGHRIHDVQTLARVSLPGRYGYRLEQLGDDLLGTDSTVAQRELKEAARRHGVPWSQKHKDYYRLWKLEPELMERYGREDVRLTYSLWNLIWARASAVDRQVYRMEIAEVAPLLREAERDGVLVDQARVRSLRGRLEDERDELRYKLLAQGITDDALGEEAYEDEDGELIEGTPASHIALRRDLLAAGVPLYRLTPKSKPPPDHTLAVNKDALTEFASSHPVVTDLLEWRKRVQTLKVYIPAMEAAQPRVHTSFSQCEARTSRMSSRRPNMQNLPTTKGVRDVLVPAPGNAFLVADYSAIEVHALAYYVGHPDLIAMLESGEDPHQHTAYNVARATGDTTARFEDFFKAEDEGEEDGPRKKERDKAKVTTFTALYGGGARLLSTRLNCPVTEAAQIKQAVLDAIPGYWDFDDKVKLTLRRRMPAPYVTTITGRRLSVPKDKPYVGPNTLIQGTSAELMKLGLIASAPVLARYGYRLRLVVHDEIVAEGPADLAEQALPATIHAMETAYPMRPRLRAAGSWSTDSYGAAK